MPRARREDDSGSDDSDEDLRARDAADTLEALCDSGLSDMEMKDFAIRLFQRAVDFNRANGQHYKVLHSKLTYLTSYIFYAMTLKLAIPVSNLTGDDADGEWERVSDLVKKYLDNLLLEGAVTKEASQVLHAQVGCLPLMEAHSLSLFLGRVFVPYWDRRATFNDSSSEASHNMVDQCIQGAEKIAKAEAADMMRILGLRRAEDNVRSEAVKKIKKNLQLATSTNRRLRGSDPLVGTALATINSDSFNKMAHHALRTGRPDHIRTMFYLLKATAVCFRGGTMENLTTDCCFLGELGDRRLVNQKRHELFSVLHDKSKENLTGHRTVSGSVHSMDVFTCPNVFEALYFFILVVLWGQDYPDFDDNLWFGHPVFQAEANVNTKRGLSAAEVRAGIQELYQEALKVDKSDLVGKPIRHAGRHVCVMIMNAAGIPAEDQNDLGWGNKFSRRNEFYGWNTIGRNAALALAGTCRDDYGQQSHSPPHRNRTPSDEVCRDLHASPFEVAQKWATSGQSPPSEAAKGHNSLRMAHVRTLIEALPIIYESYAPDPNNADHFLNHAAFKRFMEGKLYQSYAVDQLAAYRAALASPASAEQQTILSIAAAQRRQEADAQLIRRAVDETKDEVRSMRRLLEELLELQKQVQQQPHMVPAGPPLSEATSGGLTAHPSSDSPPAAAPSPALASAESALFREVFKFQNAKHMLCTLEVLNQKQVTGVQHGCAAAVDAYFIGRKKPDGLNRWPPIQAMDAKFGEDWVTRKIEYPRDTQGKITDSTPLHNHCMAIRSVVLKVMSKIPASEPQDFANAMRQAQILDTQRGNHEYLVCMCAYKRCTNGQGP